MSKQTYKVELRLCIRHEAEARLRQAYGRLSQTESEVNDVVALASGKESPDATSRPLCPSLDPEPGKGSHD
jgi:hypothetical protein